MKSITETEADTARRDFRVTDAWFDVPVCRNCGAALSSKYCGACGQKKAERFSRKDLQDEAWEKLRWFEMGIVKTAWNAALRPGRVARDYVLGARKKHAHPLKLLLVAIVVLLVVIAQTDYLAVADPTLNKAVALVQSYSKWSFSLGIVAVLVASLTVFWRRGGYNFFEHLVLAAYVQFVLIAANIINLSPLLVKTSPELVEAHRRWTGYYMDWVEGAIVMLAFGQFFNVDWRRDWWRPALGALVFYLAKTGLIYLYARAVIRIVIAQLA